MGRMKAMDRLLRDLFWSVEWVQRDELKIWGIASLTAQLFFARTLALRSGVQAFAVVDAGVLPGLPVTWEGFLVYS